MQLDGIDRRVLLSRGQCVATLWLIPTPLSLVDQPLQSHPAGDVSSVFEARLFRFLSDREITSANMSGSKMFENFLFNYNMTFIKFTKVSAIVSPHARACNSQLLKIEFRQEFSGNYT